MYEYGKYSSKKGLSGEQEQKLILKKHYDELGYPRQSHRRGFGAGGGFVSVAH
jgi:hypothetical protein